jgi:hypothetical protein
LDHLEYNLKNHIFASKDRKVTKFCFIILFFYGVVGIGYLKPNSNF